MHMSAMEKELKDLIIRGTKYTANKDFTKAAEIYAKILDSLIKGRELDDVDFNKEDLIVARYMVSMAQCLFEMALENTDLFGGLGNGIGNADEDDDNEDDNDDGSPSSHSGSDIDGEDSDNEGKPTLNKTFFQFDHEEEEEEEEDDDTEEEKKGTRKENKQFNESNIESEEESALESEEAEEEEDINDGDNSIMKCKHFSDYLTGDFLMHSSHLAEKAYELYNKSGSYCQESIDASKIIGDINLEWESFETAVDCYKTALKTYQRVYNKMDYKLLWSVCEAMKYCEEVTGAKPSRERLKYLKQISIDEDNDDAELGLWAENEYLESSIPRAGPPSSEPSSSSSSFASFVSKNNKNKKRKTQWLPSVSSPSTANDLSGLVRKKTKKNPQKPSKTLRNP
ncbi:Hif1p NDAI_0D02990 [Naumovozyma dairenensis CBS 421]|uniref:Tetratricopeptide SHNi-TPR domain-containing protein n=1 Tax=Naumovozyma dairenensis (strain ATCC 10597 / BCRC 20456 / CBS 421 / NBRC 0211 / NRRL Y-12639) TaxID=1071378 RepID=G0WA02_NAUDC|nr:hypothetical protein NDAI_0D02990 [Naumovozyma dairenensis CBS 421]CCD24613.1 hypothetical protein NDAI_0D02990 [Naumovozyma dairenensis CBS 421]